MAFLLKNFSNAVFRKQIINAYVLQGQPLQLQTLKTTAVPFNPNNQKPETTKTNDSSNNQKKQKETIKITLIQNQNMTVIGLEDAKSLAKRRSMHLAKIQDMDPKTKRPVYKLLTATEMLQTELSDITKSDKSVGTAKKSEKSITIGSRIAEHDLSSRLKNISKWLNKQHEVRILIQATSEKDLVNCEKIFKTIEEMLKTPQVIGRIVQKRTKGNIVRFSILPVEPATSEKTAINSQ